MLYIKELLGHSSVTTTINLYGHMFPSVEASLADALDAMYDEPEPMPLRRSLSPADAG